MRREGVEPPVPRGAAGLQAAALPLLESNQGGGDIQTPALPAELNPREEDERVVATWSLIGH